MGSKQTSTSRADPWQPTQAGLRGIVGDAKNLYDAGGFNVNPYQGDWVAGQNGDTMAARAGIAGAVPGMQGDSASAADALRRIMGQGSTDEMRRAVTEDVMPGINATFAGSGMTGSSLHEQNLAKGLGSAFGGMEMGVRGQQMGAAQALPGVSQSGLNPLMALMQSGAGQQGYDQSVIDAAMRKDLMGQSAGAGGLQSYAQLLSGLGGQFGTQTNTQKQSMGLGGILGLGLQFAGL